MSRSDTDHSGFEDDAAYERERIEADRLYERSGFEAVERWIVLA